MHVVVVVELALPDRRPSVSAYSVSQDPDAALVQLDTLAIAELSRLVGKSPKELDIRAPNDLEPGYNLIEYINRQYSDESLALVYYTEENNSYTVDTLYTLSKQVKLDPEKHLREGFEKLEREHYQDKDDVILIKN